MPYRALRPDQVARFLRSLPLTALLALPNLAAHPGVVPAIEALHVSGITTLARLADLPAAVLARRFGPLGSALALLAAGHDLVPLRAGAHEAWIGARLRLAPAVSAAALAAALAPLAAHLAAVLAARGQEATALALALECDRAPLQRMARRLAHPCARATALDAAARPLLAALTMSTPQATYGGIHLRVGALRPALPRQRDLWLPPGASARAPQDAGARWARVGRALEPLERRTGRPLLLRGVVAAPAAVFSEERYLLGPLAQPAEEGSTYAAVWGPHHGDA